MPDADGLLRRCLEGRLQSAFHNLSLAKKNLGDQDYHQAAIFATKACIIDQHNLEARYLKGFCHRILGEVSEAVDTYQQITGMVPGSAVAHLYLADCLRNAGRMEEAIHYYLESMKLDTEGDVRELARESVVAVKESLVSRA